MENHSFSITFFTYNPSQRYAIMIYILIVSSMCIFVCVMIFLIEFGTICDKNWMLIDTMEGPILSTIVSHDFFMAP